MQRANLTRKKVKRILVYYHELESMKVSHEAAMEIMEYVFAISSRWMEELLRRHSIQEFNDITLEYVHIDMLMIDAFVNSMRSTAKANRKKRTTQLLLF
ncbi:MAG: hypothetical protein Q8O72_10525 [Bacteroidales bacterium]|nr:hypothetical protein [Bacteroidales bacterium]